MRQHTFRALAFALLGALFIAHNGAALANPQVQGPSADLPFLAQPGSGLLTSSPTQAPDLLSVLTGKAAQSEQTVTLRKTRIEDKDLVLELDVQTQGQYFVEPSTLKLTLKAGQLALEQEPDRREKQTGVFEARFSLESLKAGPNALELTYQGCTENGVCLPPKTLMADFTAEQSISPGLWGKAGAILIFGLLLGLSPCVLPIAPLVVSSLSQSGSSKLNKTAKSILFLSSMATVYAALGVFASLAGQGLSTLIQTQAIQIASGLFLMGMALATYKGVYFSVRVPNWLEQKTMQVNSNASLSYVNVVLSGALSAVVVSPCVSAGLAGILAYVAEQGEPLKGAIWLAALCLGMGLPLVVCAALAITRIRASVWMKHAQQLSALLMLGLGLAIAFGQQALFEPIAAALLALYLLGTLIFKPKNQTYSNLSHALLILALFASASYAVVRADQLLQLGILKSSSDTQQVQSLSAEQFLAHLQEPAQQEAKSIRAYFVTASWCATCNTLKESLINPQQIKTLLGSPEAQLYFVDITENSAQDRTLLEQFKLFGPPGLLVYQGPNLLGSLNGEMQALDIEALAAKRAPAKEQ